MVDKLLNDASYRSYWRGYEYFKEGRVKNIQRFDGTTYSAIVSGCKDYHVKIDFAHPRKSTCDCPHAEGRRVVCKHIVAVSLCLDESEADRFKYEKTIYASEEEERRAKKYEKYMGFARTMSPRELREAYVELMIELDEYRLKEKYGR